MGVALLITVVYGLECIQLVLEAAAYSSVSYSKSLRLEIVERPVVLL